MGACTIYGQNQADPVGRHITQYQFVDDFSMTFGKHTLKAGIDFLRDDLNVFQYGNQTAGTITTSLADFYNGSGESTSFNKSFPLALHRGFAAYDLGFYGEDDWAVRPGLKLTLALRLDRQSNTNCPTNCFARLAAPLSPPITTLQFPTMPPFRRGCLTRFTVPLPLPSSLGSALPGPPSGTQLPSCAAVSGTFATLFRNSLCRDLRSTPLTSIHLT